MTIVVGFIMFIVGFILSSMFCLSSKVDLEEQLYDREEKIARAIDYANVIITSDMEGLDLKETTRSIKGILGGK